MAETTGSGTSRPARKSSAHDASSRGTAAEAEAVSGGSGGADRAEPRVIKRYANRKLYDMSESCYVTQDEIAELVKSGVEVRIIDNRTKEDLTTLTLTQILFKEEKKQRRTLPLHTLRGILQSGGDFIQRHITDPVTTLRDEAGETVRSTITNVFRREDEEGYQGEPGEGAAAASPRPTETPVKPAPKPAPEPVRPAPVVDERGRPIEGMREWLDSTQVSFETLQRTLEDRWRLITNSLSTLDANRKRIRELEARVAALEARLAAAEGVPAEDNAPQATGTDS